MIDWKSRKPQLSIAFEDEEFCTVGAYSLVVNKLRATPVLVRSIKQLFSLNEKEEELLNRFRNSDDSLEKHQDQDRLATHPYSWRVGCDNSDGMPEFIGGRAKSIDHAKQCAEAAYKIFETTRSAMVDVMDS